jgi:3-methyladenine DNA glycosylase AlkC
MPEPLKNLFSPDLLNSLSRDVKAIYPEFDKEGFCEFVFDVDWNRRELKDRMRHIAVALRQYLPQDFQEAIEILKKVSSGRNGFEYMFFPDFVELYGLDDFELSVSALEYFTSFSSSEFAVRPFIMKYPARMVKEMESWAESSNLHIRRLASEGCRPRLPWAMALPGFKTDPTPILAILEKLKNDESEYVRRSVANNLNDISKDNPQLVFEIAKRWSGKSSETDKLIKHACRSLLKSGDPEIMAFFGFPCARHIIVDSFQVQDHVEIGGEMVFSFNLKSNQSKLGKLRIEYAIDFMKKNGRQSRKLFKLSESDNLTSGKSVTRKHSFKKISTRKYYCGQHDVAIIVNGIELAKKDFVLADN